MIEINLKHLMLIEERQLTINVIEFLTVLDERIAERIGEKPADKHEDFALRSFFWTGLAYKTLHELRKMSSNIFVITNDAPHDQTLPYDDSLPGSIREEAFQNHSWIAMNHGFGSKGARFEKDLRFDNYVFHLQDGNFSEFVDDFLGGRISPTVYWYAFANEDTDISTIDEAFRMASTEEELKTLLCRSCLLLAHGFEMDCFIFVAATPEVANLIRKSLRVRA